jgi:hypothetical protein
MLEAFMAMRAIEFDYLPFIDAEFGGKIIISINRA